MSDTNEFVKKSAWRLTWVELLVLIALVSVLVAILLPMVQQARERAREAQSRNNLRGIGLALHNYHDTFRVLPPGGLFSEKGVPIHSWTTFMAEYLDAHPIHPALNFSLPWDDPAQLDFFITHPPLVLSNPRLIAKRRPDGLLPVQYAGNSWIFYRNSSVTLKEIGDLNGTLFASEARGNFLPNGCPGNWRDVHAGLNTVNAAFGCRDGAVTKVLLADGSVRDFGANVDPAVWNSLAGSKLMQPTAAQRQRVECPSDLSKRPIWRYRDIYHWKAGTAHFRLSPEGSNLSVRFDDGLPKGLAERELDLPQLCDATLRELQQYGEIRRIRITGPVEIKVVEVLSRPQNLRTLTLSAANVKGDEKGFRKRLRKSVTVD